MLNNLYMKKNFWLLATLFYSLTFFVVDELFIYGLAYIAEENRLFFHRSALFLIVMAFIAYSQYTLNQITIMNKQMLQSAKLVTLGEMSSMVAHDIVRPLANIDMQVQMNLKKGGRSAEFLAFNHLVKAQLDRCISLVDSLRMFGRDSVNSPKKKNNMNAIILETLNLISPYLSFTSVSNNLADGIPDVECNAHQLEQVFANIIMNAKDAIESKQNGLITIRSFVDKNAVIVNIEDNGKGMSKSDLSQIYTPFYTTKVEGKGTGLGLTISNRIMKDHNGEILVESTPGKTVFKLIFNLS